MVDSGERVASSRVAHFESFHKWASTVAGVAALAISLYNFTELQQNPQIDVTLPHTLRLGQEGKASVIYVQPTVSTRLKTQSVEVVRDTRLDVIPAGSTSSSARPVFYWSASGTWAYDFNADSIDWRWIGDPAPFIVSQDKPQQPTLRFQANDWSFRPGRYKGVLKLSRSGGRNALFQTFCLMMPKEAVKEIREGPKRTIYFFRNDVPRSSSSSASSGCYEWQKG
ncbi:hypothetical protein [Streptomyces lydicus]|uniref:hypothetical protein n=1 Tax=Streptomyces lydicus TaxID=47763 RepID=UPI0034346F61